MATPKATVKKKQAAKKAAKPARERPEPELLLPSGVNDDLIPVDPTTKSSPAATDGEERAA